MWRVLRNQACEDGKLLNEGTWMERNKHGIRNEDNMISEVSFTYVYLKWIAKDVDKVIGAMNRSNWNQTALQLHNQKLRRSILLDLLLCCVEKREAFIKLLFE